MQLLELYINIEGQYTWTSEALKTLVSSKTYWKLTSWSDVMSIITCIILTIAKKLTLTKL